MSAQEKACCGSHAKEPEGVAAESAAASCCHAPSLAHEDHAQHDHSHHGHPHDHHAQHAVKDPVCGMTIDEKTAAGKSEYKGQTYYFCAPGCKKKFDADPARYAGSTGPR